MSKATELLQKIDAEVLEKVNAKVAEADEQIKAAAQIAYEDSVKASIANIKEEVEKEYAVARAYLQEIIATETPEGVEATDPEEDAIEEDTLEEAESEGEVEADHNEPTVE